MAAYDDTKPYHVTSQSLTLFQLQAFRQQDRWVMSVPFGEGPESYVLVELRPSSSDTAEEILQVISEDRAAGRAHLIDHILITNRVAAALFLEGTLRVEHFATSTLSEDQTELTLSLLLEEHLWTIKIRSEFDPKLQGMLLSTRDREGNVV